MTHLADDGLVDFADAAVAGFARAFAPWVRPAPGGVVRRTDDPSPRVAIVVGGGSGHYPAFCGLVGPGLAHGAAMGNVFASPSAQQVYAIARAADRGRGVLLAYGNYAGDVLNFNEAQRRLREEGVSCETVRVTDDVSSAPPDSRHLRRGIAGGLAVFKIAGAAAAEGLPLTDVLRLAGRANDRTRTLGVAFGGCTLPGAAAPLFTVPGGRMAVGMGIHGEPGIEETAVPSAGQLADRLVGTLLGELPADVPQARGARAVAILNGLGGVKYEELFGLYDAVGQRLERAGVRIVEPEVGELVTSLEMAGVSLTLCWLDDELERLWGAPASTPAFRKGTVAPLADGAVVTHADPAATPATTPGGVTPAGAAGRRGAAAVRDALAAAARAVDTHVDELGRLDAVAGDGDHGIGMRRGVHAALDAAGRVVDAGGGTATALRHAGDAWAERAGGTSGMLWGVALRAAGDAVGDETAPDAQTLAAAIDAATAAVLGAGGAAVGDKTMADALVPFRDAFRAAAPDGLTAALAAAVPVAEASARATAGMTARLGRARTHGDRSLGTPDPGAVSAALVLRAVLDTATAPATLSEAR
ncbi:dihydroxyacetone kinase family protein [Dactylosporangium sp. AC04546]|uniref:dihydroxyacetone kinase family protein n=1 Tax=Dactylosporangium sp. AC04546 TaxID=2862460 RepID=UPI001EDFA4AF|nr:dihydroxyacetone kinase family protein [Dactylosporangium sp. AC04546]WVK87183.1 dihydroxyacetone kinase family protein [Dactylosporangium sp. AC04546]